MPMFGKQRLVKYVLLGILSGILNFLFINCVTRVINLIISGSLTTVNKDYLLIAAGIVLLVIGTRRLLSLGIIRSSQNLFWRLRKHILSFILGSNYQQLTEKRSNIQTAIFRDVYVLTDASMIIIQFFTAMILSIACLIYLASISIILFAITLFVASIGISVYYVNNKKISLKYERSRVLENKFLEHFNALLHGFKEINMDSRKGHDIYDRKIAPVADESFKNNISAHAGFLTNQVTGQILFYLLISSVLLVLGILLNIKPGNIVSFVFTLLYLLGSIETIMGALPGLARAKVAAIHLLNLKKELEEEQKGNRIPSRYISKQEFDTLSVSQLEFSYKDADKNKTFGVGPISLDIRKGETIFIYGGNGSGKTTLIHSLIGIRPPMAGEILLNGIPVTTDNYPEYRTLFAVVFSDFYLFNDLPGIRNFSMEKWEYYLQLFELDNKVKLDGHQFSTIDLSTGQRKRLALIAALLEEKPILVLDEWAADQDPYFRKKFYTEILPALKEEGLTIIGITHDDKYYHTADKLYKMDYGRLTIEDVTIYSAGSLLN